MTSSAAVTRRAGAIVTLLAACATAAPAEAGRTPEPTPAARPSLVVLVTVDQFRADLLTRFGSQLQGGLARLVREGAVFTDAHHDHAIPETAPGHATLLSGRFPRSTRILLNAVGVDDPSTPLVGGAPGAGASPHRFRGTTLVDWMRARDSSTRVLSVSGKDRGAILPIGRALGEVYWYAPDGRFTTSTYYRDTLPTWLRRFNDRGTARRYAGASWTLLLPQSAYPEPDSVNLEGAGHQYLFPHRAPADSAGAALFVSQTPWIDEIVLGLALEGVRELGLGTGSRADLLNISLSATDAIGHLYGPDSREMHDQVLRLDRALGVFLDSLYKLRDPGRVVLAFTADHGSASLPELSARTMDPMPLRVEPQSLLYGIREKLRKAGGDTAAVDVALGLVFMNREALAKAGIAPDTVLDAIAAAARTTQGVLRADRLRDLRRADHRKDPIARRWSHLLPEGIPVEMVVTLAPYSIWWSDNVASHHSPHDYDTHVPLIFLGPSIRPGRIPGFVRTVDLAPTLAAVLGVQPLEPLDGVVLKKALK